MEQYCVQEGTERLASGSLSDLVKAILASSSFFSSHKLLHRNEGNYATATHVITCNHMSITTTLHFKSYVKCDIFINGQPGRQAQLIFLFFLLFFPITDTFQALIQFSDPIAAQTAKVVSQSLFVGGKFHFLCNVDTRRNARY